MNKKYVLKPCVKNTIVAVVIFTLLLQLFLLNYKLNKVIDKIDDTTVVIEMRCSDGR